MKETHGNAGSDNARRRGVGTYPRLRKDVLVAAQMIAERGLKKTLAHARTIALTRLHYALIDGRAHGRLPEAILGEETLDDLTLRSHASHEREAAAPFSPVPSKTFHWALKGTGIDPSIYHFIDIGSGRGYALLLASAYRFRRLTGVEFAQELHEDAAVNLEWAHEHGLVDGNTVDLRHESALKTELPLESCLIFLFNPFDETVMRPFLERIDRSVASNPRSIVVLYVNPKQHLLFARSGVREIALRTRHRWLLRTISPYDACAFAWGPEPSFQEY